MSAPQLLVQAVLNRLTSRVGSGLADAAATLAVLAREAPEKLQSDWDLFWEEVQLEAERLDAGEVGAGSAAAGAAAGAASGAASGASAGPDAVSAVGDGTTGDAWAGSAAPPQSPQEQIDELRALVAGIARRLEGST
jgi:hypothetical protein